MNQHHAPPARSSFPTRRVGIALLAALSCYACEIQSPPQAARAPATPACTLQLQAELLYETASSLSDWERHCVTLARLRRSSL